MWYSVFAHRGGSARTLLVASLLLAASGCHQTLPPGSLPAPTEDKQEVNIGYGTVRREDVAGAVSSIGAKDLVVNGGGRMEELLQSKFPGVSVVRSRSGELSLRIRGNHDPLVLIDGAPIRAVDLVHVNPYDIHRVDILRDVASAAIYGVRGANGVILITTKRPR